MANSVVEIYNLALSAIGTRGKVEAVDEVSPEAEECTLWYETTRDVVFQAAPWNCATAFQQLAAVAVRDFAADWSPAAPPPEFAFEYALPGDCIRPRYLTTFEPFTLASRGSSVTLVTNAQNPILCYTAQRPIVAMWDPQLALAIAKGLGASIAMGLHGKIGRAQAALQEANELIAAARVTNSNSIEIGYDFMPSWFQARGLTVGLSTPSYIYPNGGLLSVPALFGASV